MINQVLKYFFSASDIMEAIRGRFRFYGCVIQESYCCEVGIEQQAQAQCNRLAFSVLTQETEGSTVC